MAALVGLTLPWGKAANRSVEGEAVTEQGEECSGEVGGRRLCGGKVVRVGL